MAFLSCRSCHWAQDDFWDEGHNPIRALASRTESLLLQPSLSLDGTVDPYRKTLRDVVVARLIEAAQTVLAMRYRTVAEYRAMNPNGVCPFCGLHTLTID